MDPETPTTDDIQTESDARAYFEDMGVEIVDFPIE